MIVTNIMSIYNDKNLIQIYNNTKVFYTNPQLENRLRHPQCIYVYSIYHSTFFLVQIYSTLNLL